MSKMKQNNKGDKKMNENYEKIANVCHEVNRAFCKSIGDDSQAEWKNAPKWQKDSAINGVESMIENNSTPEQSHENWLKHKESEGWVYGEKKDPEKKTHHCMVPYSELPENQKAKDYLFQAVVNSMK